MKPSTSKGSAYWFGRHILGPLLILAVLLAMGLFLFGAGRWVGAW